MKIWTQGVRLDPTLIITADNDREAKILNEFTLTDKRLVGVLKHNPGFLHPHLEIKKESP